MKLTIGIMNTTVAQWGNSLALRIPKIFADQIGLTKDSEVELTVEKDRIVVKKSCALKELLSQITPENRHPETDIGSPVGKEIW